MAQTSFQLDPGTAAAIDELKGTFGVTTSTAVIRKAIALARIASRSTSDDDGTITLTNKQGEPVKILMTN